MGRWVGECAPGVRRVLCAEATVRVELDALEELQFGRLAEMCEQRYAVLMPVWWASVGTWCPAPRVSCTAKSFHFGTLG